MPLHKEYRFADDIGRHVNWNALLPEMLDVWRAVQVTKSDDGDIVVKVIELTCNNPEHLRKDPNGPTRHVCPPKKGGE